MDISLLQKAPVFRWFYEICRIPHGSGNEAALAARLAARAKALGCGASVDEAGNVFFRKAASPGCEKAAPVMLQAHMDMVCEKRAGSQHDFAKDPIRWVIREGRLSTGGETTLGADDGIGVALAMEVLADETVVRPPLEVLFTVNEEEDFSGAAGFDASRAEAKILLNLDHTDPHTVLAGCSGGAQVTADIPVRREAVPTDFAAFSVTLEGLAGGHSGEDIHRGRGNAARLLARLIGELSERTQVYVAAFEGGTSRLALARSASAVVSVPGAGAAEAGAFLEEAAGRLREELGSAGKGVALTLRPVSLPVRGAKASGILTPLLLMPDGIEAMSADRGGEVTASDNMGVVRLTDEGLHIDCEVRAVHESAREALAARVKRAAEAFGGRAEVKNRYPGWAGSREAALTEICRTEHACLYGYEPAVMAVHCGLEVGFLAEKIPGLEAVALGPDVRDLHSPDESLGIDSVGEFYGYLRRVLERLAQ